MSRTRRTLDGQWVLITGAAKRIGACIARTLHESGANIAVHYRGSEAPATELADELNAQRSNSAVTVCADLLDTSALPDLIERLGRHAGN